MKSVMLAHSAVKRLSPAAPHLQVEVIGRIKVEAIQISIHSIIRPLRQTHTFKCG